MQFTDTHWKHFLWCGNVFSDLNVLLMCNNLSSETIFFLTQVFDHCQTSEVLECSWKDRQQLRRKSKKIATLKWECFIWQHKKRQKHLDRWHRLKFRTQGWIIYAKQIVCLPTGSLSFLHVWSQILESTSAKTWTSFNYCDYHCVKLIIVHNHTMLFCILDYWQ